MALTNLWKRIHGARLAQGSEFQIDLAKSGAAAAFMLPDVQSSSCHDHSMPTKS